MKMNPALPSRRRLAIFIASALQPRNASSAIFAFSAASIFRLGFFIIVSVYHDGADPAPIKPPVPKSVSTSNEGLHLYINSVRSIWGKSSSLLHSGC